MPKHKAEGSITPSSAEKNPESQVSKIPLPPDQKKDFYHTVVEWNCGKFWRGQVGDGMGSTFVSNISGHVIFLEKLEPGAGGFSDLPRDPSAQPIVKVLELNKRQSSKDLKLEKLSTCL
eukprot:1224240-Amphidinium_carterae.1